MANPWEYVTRAIYEDRNAQVAQNQVREDYTQDFRAGLGEMLGGIARSPFLGPAGLVQRGLQSMFQGFPGPREIAGGTPEIFEPLRQTPSPGGVLGTLGRGIERGLGRPGQALREQLINLGQTPPGTMEDIWRGRAPEGVGTFSGEQGGLQRRLGLGPLDVPTSAFSLIPGAGIASAAMGPGSTLPFRDVLGTGLDITLDPTNLIPGPQIPRLGVRGAQAGLRGALNVAPEVAGAAPEIANIGLREVVSRPYGAVARGLGQVEQLPVVGRGLGAATRRVSGRLAPPTDAFDAIRRGVEEVKGNIPIVQNRFMAPIEAAARGSGARPVPLPEIDERGVMRLLRSGDEAAASDVFQMPDQMLRQGEITPELADAIKVGGQQYQQLIGRVRTRWEALNAKHESVAKNFAGLIEEAELPRDAEQFWPRETVMPDGTIKHNWNLKPGRRRTADFEREYLTGEEKINAGNKDMHPFEAMRRRVYELEEALVNMDAAEMLADLAPHVTDRTAIAAQEAELLARRGNQQGLRAVQGLAARAMRGETIPAATLERYRQEFPQQIDLIGRTMSHRVSGAPAMEGVRGGIETMRTMPGEQLTTLLTRVNERISDLQQGIRGSRAAMTTPGVARAGVRGEVAQALGLEGTPPPLPTPLNLPPASPAAQRVAALSLDDLSRMIDETGTQPLWSDFLYHRVPDPNWKPGDPLSQMSRHGNQIFLSRNSPLDRHNQIAVAIDKSMLDPTKLRLKNEGFNWPTYTGIIPPEAITVLGTGDFPRSKLLEAFKKAVAAPEQPAVPRGEPPLPSARPLPADELAQTQQVRELVMRAIRGETVPKRELDKFREGFTSIIEPLEQTMSRTTTPPLATAAPGIERLRQAENVTRLGRLQSEITDLLKTETQAVKEARYGKRWFEAEEARARAGLKEPEVGRWRNIWLTPEESDRFSKSYAAFEEKPGAALGKLQSIFDVMRTAMTTLDASAAMIQGIPHLARNPGQFLQSFSYMVGAFLDPTTLEQFTGSQRAQRVYAALPELDIGRGTAEYVKGATILQEGVQKAGERLGQLPGAGNPLRKGARLLNSALGSTQAAFDTFGTVARTLWGEGLMDLAQRTGTQHEIAQMINHATGSVGSARGMGLTPAQRATESAILFAPNYLRSSIALMGDILQGNVAGEEARRTLSSMLVAGTVWYPAIARGMDQKPIMDPKDSRFMTVEINGVRIGIGTTWIGLVRAMFKAGDELASGDPGKLAKFEPDNPLVQFARARTSPALSLLFDSQWGSPSGQEMNSLMDAIIIGGKKFMPIVAQSILEDAEEGRGFNPVSLLGQLVGMRTFPQTPDDVRQQIATEEFGKRFEELDPYQQVTVQTDERVTSLRQPTGPQFARRTAETAAFQDYNRRVGEAAQEVRAGTRTPDQFRRQIEFITIERNRDLERLEQQYGPAKPSRRELTADEQAYQKYVDLLKQRDEFDRRDPEAIDTYLASLPEGQRTYIEQRQDAAIGRLPPEAQEVMRQLRQAQRTLKPYYDQRRIAMQRLGIWDQYKDANPAQRDAIRNTPKGQAATKLENGLKEVLRARNPAIDQALVDWHDNVPLGVSRAGVGPQWRAQQAAAQLAEPTQPLRVGTPAYRQQRAMLVRPQESLPGV